MYEGIDQVFVALADPTRLQLLFVLAEHGEASASSITAELPISRQAIVKHLAVLERGGLVTGHRQGREVLYSVCPDRLNATAGWMARVAAEWDVRLAEIKRIAEGSDNA